MIIIEIICWAIACYVLISFAEHFAHRFYMHRNSWKRRSGYLWEIYEKHSILHHGRFYKDFNNDPDSAAKYVNITMNPFENLMLGMPALLSLYFLSFTVGMIVLFVFILAHAFIWSLIHSEMHEPKQAWFAKTSVYKFLLKYHQKHHEDNSVNFNVVCPGADFILGKARI